MSDDDVSRIRARLDNPIALCAALDLMKGSKRSGSGRIILCPAHGERTASCSVTLAPDATVRVRCFGCGFAGDGLALIAAALGLDPKRDFPRVLEWAADFVGVTLDDPRLQKGRRQMKQTERRAPQPRQPSTFTVTPKLHEMIEPVAHAGRLDDSDIAGDVARYLRDRGRGLVDLATADGWFALGPPDAQQSTMQLWRDVFGDDDTRKTGMVSGNSWQMMQSGARLCIPWRNESGRIETLQRRRLDAGEPKYVFPVGGAPRYPYGMEKVSCSAPTETLWLVEGALDVLSLRILMREIPGSDRGVVLGIPGTSNWRREWGASAKGRQVRLAFDGDKAGDDVCDRIGRDVCDAGAILIRRERPRFGKDWTDSLKELFGTDPNAEVRT